MFGKPEWFQSKQVSWYLRPSSWQGWAYALAWGGALLVPCFALLSRDQGPEAVAWMVICAALWLWDSASIRKAAQATAAQQVFYIGEETELPSPQVATRKFRLPWRA